MKALEKMTPLLARAPRGEADPGVAAEAGPSTERRDPDADALFSRTRDEVLATANTPLATYRVQFHRGFGFEDARRIVPYLSRLGVSHLYASPYLAASPGSTHGYDVVDHSRLNPEVGTAEEHEALALALEQARMGQVLDVVPNHMGIERFNPLWFDVLENGSSSLFARYFDVDWQPVKSELEGKVLLPVLGDQYGIVLEAGELKVAFDPAAGAFTVRYWDRSFPVGPRQYGVILAEELDALVHRLGAQSPAVIELESILTAIRHLPERTAKDPSLILERHREKEVVKRRLATLCASAPEIAGHVEKNVERLNGSPGDPRSFDALDALLSGCSYRLAHWRVAGEEINYRRFFDINSLAAMRVEEPEVFEEAHALAFRWLREGKLQGLRVDHPDGLFDPTAYFLRLQERYFLERARTLFEDAAPKSEASEASELDGARGWTELEPSLSARWREEVERDPESPLRKALYVVVEKIQGGRERIPDAWAVHGTTGYRFANAVGGIFIDRTAEQSLTATYERFITPAGEPKVTLDYRRLLYEKKKLIMAVSMSSEINVLARELNRISEMNRRTRDFTLNSLRRALVEFIALFPVYRTYVEGGRPDVDPRDVHYIRWTLAQAKAKDPTTNVSIFDFLGDILMRRYPEHLTDEERAVMLRFVMKLQQVTGPVMAKGLEDTVFYVYNRLVSLNEVGGEPEHFGVSLDTFHLRNQERAELWPASMLTSSTHDTKRGEDVRARLNVLSEVPDAWRRILRRFARLNSRHKVEVDGRLAPELNDEYLYYQTVLGAWPMGEQFEGGFGGEAFAAFRQRILEYMLKAIKEAKVSTSWTNPDPAYEEAVAKFVERTLDPRDGRGFLEAARVFKRAIERPGQLNALAQLVLKLASPGVADTYQGSELWDLSLVDPDNRRPVDFGHRERLLAELDHEAEKDRPALCRGLAGHADDGRVKLYTLCEGLRMRQRHPELFRRGAYVPLDAVGPQAMRLVAFARELGDEVVLAVVPRFTAALLAGSGLAAAFEGTFLTLPERYAGREFRDVYSGQRITAVLEGGEPRLSLGQLFTTFPIVLLESGEEQGRVRA